MRCFIGSCLFAVALTCVGCMTGNWSTPLFQRDAAVEEPAEEEFEVFSSRGIGDEIFGSGIEPRAREIEKRLGYK